MSRLFLFLFIASNAFSNHAFAETLETHQFMVVQSVQGWVRFESNDHVISRSDALPLIDKIYEAVEASRAFVETNGFEFDTTNLKVTNIIITGRTDAEGSEAQNMILSEERIKETHDAILDILTHMSISSESEITSRAFGEKYSTPCTTIYDKEPYCVTRYQSGLWPRYARKNRSGDYRLTHDFSPDQCPNDNLGRSGVEYRPIERQVCDPNDRISMYAFDLEYLLPIEALSEIN